MTACGHVVTALQFAMHGGLMRDKTEISNGRPARRGAESANAASAPPESLLEIIDVSKSFKSRQIIDSVSMYVRSGEIVGIMGANGAGKTTCFNLVIGLEYCDEGVVQLDGADISRLPMHMRAKAGIGYLPQEPSIFRRLSVEKNILAILQTQRFASARDRANRLEQLLRTFRIEDVRYSLGLNLSGGERRRVEIARAFAMNPRFILLDEPFAGVDPIAIGDVVEQINFLRRQNIGILITDHNVRETLRICTRAYIMSHGRVIVSGSPRQIVNDPVARNHYLGTGFRL